MTKYEQALLDIIQENPKDRLGDIAILTELVKNAEKQGDRATNEQNIIENTLKRVYACINRSKIKFTQNVNIPTLEYAIKKEFNLL